MTLDGGHIRALLSEVADELEATGGDVHTIIVVGGSLLAWRNLRDTTEDVDSIRHLDAELRVAVAAVAARHDLAIDWLNDHAAAFAPNDLDIGACELLLDRSRLRVLGAPLRDVFLMKLNRAQPQDLNDLRAIWPLVREHFANATDIVGAFYEAFPAAPHDEHLDSFIVEELGKGGYDIPPS